MTAEELRQRLLRLNRTALPCMGDRTNRVPLGWPTHIFCQHGYLWRVQYDEGQPTLLILVP